jgi:hypothetical protein
VTFDRARFELEISAARSRKDITRAWVRCCLHSTTFCRLPRDQREALYEIAASAAKELPQ